MRTSKVAGADRDDISDVSSARALDLERLEAECSELRCECEEYAETLRGMGSASEVHALRRQLQQLQQGESASQCRRCECAELRELLESEKHMMAEVGVGGAAPLKA